MAETPNHSYNVPDQGQEDWHDPLNENFEDYDTDIEIRDNEANLSEYEPETGTKLLATDTGVVYLGDGTTWNPQYVFPGYDSAADEVSFSRPVVATDVELDTLGGSLTGGTALTTIAGSNLSIDSNGQLNASTGTGGGISSLDGGDGINPTSIGDGDTLSVAWGDTSDLDASGAVDTISGTVTGGTTLTSIAGNNLSIDSNGQLNASTGTDGGISSLDGGNGIDPDSIGDGDTLSVATGDIAGTALEADGTDLAVSSGGIGSTELASGAVTSTEISDGTIGTADIGGNGASDGHVLRWNGSDWETGFPGTTGSTAVFELEAGGETVVQLDPNDTLAPSVVIGTGHTVSAQGVTIGGGEGNTASDLFVTVGGGGGNTASNSYATVGGGRSNTASSEDATVAGGFNNTASELRATVGGGERNTAEGDTATVGGGRSNIASATDATVGGGKNNTASAEQATVGGGNGNTASDRGATVGGGATNTASETDATVAGGFDNTASGNSATVPGGNGNEASGSSAFAAGNNATASHDGSFVFGDSSGVEVESMFPDEARFQGGLRSQLLKTESYVLYYDGQSSSADWRTSYAAGDDEWRVEKSDITSFDKKMWVTADGDIKGKGSKDFVDTVDTDDGEKEVHYTAAESGTPHTDVSGVAELEDGRAEVPLPDHFGWVTGEEDPLHVQTTPYSAESGGLAVVERSIDRLVVEDLDGEGEYEFSYTVRGTREGYEDKQVVREPSATTTATDDASPADD